MEMLLEEKKSFDYILLELRMKLNRELFNKKIISLDVFSQMQNLLVEKMSLVDAEE